MPHWGEQITENFTAAADLSSYQFRIVHISAANNVNLTYGSAASDLPFMIGVLQNKPASGEHAQVAVAGVSKMVVDGAAGTITVGQSVLTTGSDGKGVATTTAGSPTIALAMEGSTANDDVITVLINRSFYQPT
jgi:hypothetical protein